jgi:hypothetical protein
LILARPAVTAPVSLSLPARLRMSANCAKGRLVSTKSGHAKACLWRPAEASDSEFRGAGFDLPATQRLMFTYRGTAILQSVWAVR